MDITKDLEAALKWADDSRGDTSDGSNGRMSQDAYVLKTLAAALRARDERIKKLEAKLNSPELHDFSKAVVLEAAQHPGVYDVAEVQGKLSYPGRATMESAIQYWREQAGISERALERAQAELSEQMEQRASEMRINNKLGQRCAEAESKLRESNAAYADHFVVLHEMVAACAAWHEAVYNMPGRIAGEHADSYCKRLAEWRGATLALVLPASVKDRLDDFNGRVESED